MSDSKKNGIESDDEFVKRYGEMIGSGQSAVIYSKEGIAAKVYREGQPKKQVYQEAFTLAVVRDCGIPSPEIFGVETFSGRTALLMEKVKGKSLWDMMTENPAMSEEYMDRVVELQTEMHKILTTEFRPLKLVLIGTILASPGITDEEKKLLEEKLNMLPDGYSVCHGDFHSGNILFDGEKYQIIDWAEVACGSPAADACRSYMDFFIYDEKLADMYLEKYCKVSGLKKDEILKWLPVMAGSIYGFMNEEARKKIRQFF